MERLDVSEDRSTAEALPKARKDRSPTLASSTQVADVFGDALKRLGASCCD